MSASCAQCVPEAPGGSPGGALRYVRRARAAFGHAVHTSAVRAPRTEVRHTVGPVGAAPAEDRRLPRGEAAGQGLDARAARGVCRRPRRPRRRPRPRRTARRPALPPARARRDARAGEAATLCAGGCNLMFRRLQPHVPEAATLLCAGCCHSCTGGLPLPLTPPLPLPLTPTRSSWAARSASAASSRPPASFPPRSSHARARRVVSNPHPHPNPHPNPHPKPKPEPKPKPKPVPEPKPKPKPEPEQARLSSSSAGIRTRWSWSPPPQPSRPRPPTPCYLLGTLVT